MKWGRDKKSATGNATGDPAKEHLPAAQASESRERSPRSMSPDELRVLWRDSSDYATFKKSSRRGVITAIITAALAAGGWYVLSGALVPDTKDQFEVSIVGSFAIGLGVLYAYVLGQLLREQRARRQFTDRIRFGLVENLQRNEQKLAEEAENGQLDLASLWAATQQRIDAYHEIATNQADSSFKVGQWAMIAGFGVVAVLGFVAAFARDGTASIAASVAGVAGAALSAYIGSTFMKAQTEASKQLSQFFLQPVEFSRLLGAERLLETLEKSERTVAVQRVIETMMIAPGHGSAAKKETKGDGGS